MFNGALFVPARSDTNIGGSRDGRCLSQYRATKQKNHLVTITISKGIGRPGSHPNGICYDDGSDTRRMGVLVDVSRGLKRMVFL